MKYLTPLLLIIVFLAVPVQGENNAIYNTLMTNYIAMTWADFAVTYYNLDCHRTELNPIAQLYIDKPGLAVSFLVLDNLVVGYVTKQIYKNNKVLGIGLIVLVTMVKAYILYRNVELLRR